MTSTLPHTHSRPIMAYICNGGWKLQLPTQWPFRRPKIPFVVPIFSRGHEKPHRGPSYGTGRGISTEKTWVAECRDILAYSHPHGKQPLGMATVTPFHEGNTVAQSHVWNDLLEPWSSIAVVYPSAMTRLPQTRTRPPNPQDLLSPWALLMLPPDFPVAALSSFPNT